MKISYGIIGWLLLAITANAAVKLPQLVSNGMVLQRNTPLKIWGWANPGEEITLTFKHKTYRTKTGENKQWMIVIAPQLAGGPYTMQINKIELRDLLIGDVWLCSGQSNMEAMMGRANIKATYPQVIAQSNYPQIRQFTVKRAMKFNPTGDVGSDKGWVSVNPETVLDFSAVAYFFARELHTKYKIPIGIINSSVGGTPIQSWVNSESLKGLPAYDTVAQKLKDTTLVAQILKAHQLKTEAWYKSIKEDDLGVIQKWHLATAPPGTDWQQIIDLAKLDQQVKLPKYGSMWFKTTVNIPGHLAAEAAILSLGMMHTEDETYLNGQKIGSINSGYTDRNYVIKAGSLKAGENEITIRLTSPTTGMSFNPKNTYQVKFNNDSIVLNNPWKFKFGIEKDLLPKGNGLSLHSPTAYYYAMIKPLANYRIKGMVWYQGESNIPRPEEYYNLLTSLINLWRKDWQQVSLPFLYVQLPNYSATGIEPVVSHWALLREAQAKAVKIPHTAMVVTHDIGEKEDLHPRNKLDVGKRLSLAAQKIAYGENIVSSGPLYRSISIAGKEIHVTFDHVGGGLIAKGQALKGFTISADGKNFIPAQAKIIGKQVAVSNAGVSKPVAVRYAWADSPDDANLYNQEGLPASSFKSN
ncbi:sialate O-acetylesterase [Pedobacter insulae]|nr:sialate O-acetylesterase [Pedobacter insulae]